MTMRKRLIFAALQFVLFGTGISNGQICQSSHSTDLYCLFPAAFHTTSAPFSAFYTPFGTELSQLPTARPGGLVLEFRGGVLSPSTESLGAVFSERAESIGAHRTFVGFTYQFFKFSSIDGNSLDHLPIVLTLNPNSAAPVYTVTTNRIDLKAHQYTLLGTYGVSKTVDVSVAIPIERISLSTAVSGTEYQPATGAKAPFQEYVPGSSSGIGDVIIGAKGLVADLEKLRVALGVDVRIPSGDELNFLGSGTVGVKPYIALTRRGSYSPHANIGYQWNGDSILNANSQGGKQQLPTDLFYSVGLDATFPRPLTLVVDLLGQQYFDAPRLNKRISYPLTNVTGNCPNSAGVCSVNPTTDSYNSTSLGLGFKAQTYRRLVITGNLLIKLNDGGLRSKVVPLAGLSY
jgi:hypothetical protein